MITSPTTNASVAKAEAAAATKATNRIRSTMLIRARAPAGPARRAMSFVTTAQAMATASAAAREAILTLPQFQHR
jgi:hypothetical protein